MNTTSPQCSRSVARQPLPDRRRRQPGRVGHRRAAAGRRRRRGDDPRQLLPGHARGHPAYRGQSAAQGGAGRRDAAAAAAGGDQGHRRRAASRRCDVADHGPRSVDGAGRQHSRHAERDRGGLHQRREEAGVCLLQRRLRLRPRHRRRSRREHAVPFGRCAAGRDPVRRQQDGGRAAVPRRASQARAELRGAALLHRLRRAPALPRRQRPLHHRDARPRAGQASARR